MAESVESLQTDYFNIGSTVWCRTCHNDDVKGEVLAFDPQAKMLILKSSGSSDKPNMCNVNVVNLSLVRDVKVKRECYEPPPPLENLNTTRLTRRLRDNVDEKKRLIAAMEHGVSPEGQSLYLAITKTIPFEVSWSGTDIVVMNEVTISAPYKPENVKGRTDSKAYIHVRKIVEKHAREQAQRGSKTPSPPNGAGDTSPTSSSSSASSSQKQADVAKEAGAQSAA